MSEEKIAESIFFFNGKLMENVRSLKYKFTFFAKIVIAVKTQFRLHQKN